MGIAENIDALLVRYDIPQSTLARIAGVEPATVSRWRHGVIPREEPIRKIVDYFPGLTRDDIVSDSAGLAAKEHSAAISAILPEGAFMPAPSPKATAPLYGDVHAGVPTDEDVTYAVMELPAEVAERHPEAYFLRVDGDCMDKVYPEGCMVLVDPTLGYANGRIMCLEVEGIGNIMRRVYRSARTLLLAPESTNPEHEDIVLSADEAVVRTLGRVVWFQSAGEL
jgi:repressor LexA